MQLARSVLSAIPVYFMASFRLPAWVIKRIDQIRRRFIWGQKQQGGDKHLSDKLGSGLLSERLGGNGSHKSGFAEH